jgi:sodium-independent sulfate anion transporter 11
MARSSAEPSSAVPPSTKAGHSIAKFLGIELQDDTPYEQTVTRGESVYSINTPYIEPEPTVLEYVSQFKPTLRGVRTYFLSFFPFLTWIGRYNLKWAYGDLTAGITVGCVVIPQGSEFL